MTDMLAEPSCWKCLDTGELPRVVEKAPTGFVTNVRACTCTAGDKLWNLLVVIREGTE